VLGFGGGRDVACVGGGAGFDGGEDEGVHVDVGLCAGAGVAGPPRELMPGPSHAGHAKSAAAITTDARARAIRRTCGSRS
jgi:hypothetical protein